MILKILTYASLVVAASAYYSHQVPIPAPHPAPYYGHSGVHGNYGYHGNYLGHSYGHVLGHNHGGAVNPWVVAPAVHTNNINPHQYVHGDVYRGHTAAPNYLHSPAVVAPHAVGHSNHIVPPSVRFVNQPAPHLVRPIHYQPRPAIPTPVFSHHAGVHPNDANWGW